MAFGGVAELAFGVKAEGANLEDIAQPLSAEDAQPGDRDGKQADGATASPDRHQALRCRAQAEEERARGADHRAAAHQLSGRRDGNGRRQTEQTLAEMAELEAQRLDEQAAAHDALAEADGPDVARARAGARAAQERARGPAGAHPSPGRRR